MVRGGVTPDGQHIINGSMEVVGVWSVATDLVSTCRGHTGAVARWRRCPTAELRGGDTCATVRVWLLDGTLKNTFTLHTHDVTLVALPDNQHALSGSRPTVKLQRRRRRRPAHLHAPHGRCAPWR